MARFDADQARADAAGLRDIIAWLAQLTTWPDDRDKVLVLRILRGRLDVLEDRASLRVCHDCGVGFVLTMHERQSYLDANQKLPNRCLGCRRARRGQVA